MAGCGREQEALAIQLVINGDYDEGVISVPDYLVSLTIASLERNLDLEGNPRIVGAFDLTKSPRLADFEISHVMLDGALRYDAIFYQTEPGADQYLQSFVMFGCVIRGYTGCRYINVRVDSAELNSLFIVGNAVISEPDTCQEEFSKALKMTFPWTVDPLKACGEKAC